VITHDDLADQLLDAACICRGARQLLLADVAVPCPDCGDDV